MNPVLRRRLFVIGASLLLAGTIALAVENVLWRNQWTKHAYGEAAIWHELGMLVVFVSFVLLLFGGGWKRWVLTACALIEFYLWFSGLAFLVQMS